jgi:hypothetical protein
VAGIYTETAAFSGDSNYGSSSSSQTSNFAINSATSTTAVTSSGPSTYGQSVTFTASIVGENGHVKGRRSNVKSRVISGTVTWSANTGCGTTLVTVDPDDSGTATCTTSSLLAGTDQISGTYNGDSNHGVSSGMFSQTVNQAATTPVFGNLTQTYTGSALSPTVTTTPSGLSYSSTGYPDTNAGSYPVTATITDPNYTGTASATFTITKASQTINVTVGPPATAAFGTSFTIVANATSGLQIAYASSGACTNVGATYTMLTKTTKTSGTVCNVTLTQAGGSNYTAATPYTGSTTIAKAIKPTVSFTASVTSAPYLSSFTVTATTNASTTATITATGPCTLNGTTVTMNSGTGTCALEASWPADDVYTAATAKASVKAEKLVPSVTISAPSTAVEGSTFAVTTTATAGDTGTLTITVKPATVCTVSGTNVTMKTTTKAPGTCTIEGKWAASSDYDAATATTTTTATAPAAAKQ